MSIAADHVEGRACVAGCGTYFVRAHGFPVYCNACFNEEAREGIPMYQRALFDEDQGQDADSDHTRIMGR